MSAILEIKNINKFFGKRQIIFDNTFSVSEGEVFGFLGPNGAGKTTNIKMILGLLSIDSGEVSIGGHNINNEFEAALAMVSGIVENPEMYTYLSGRDNLKIYARARGVTDKALIDYAIERVGLQNRIDDKVKRYSLGMRQRLSIAMCLSHNPKLLVLDEPTNGLDPSGIKEVRDLLVSIAHKDNVGVFVSSHLLSEMQQMCDRICIINHGKIVGFRNMGELSEFETEKVYRYMVKPISVAADLCNTVFSDKYVYSSPEFIDLKASDDNEASEHLKIMLNKGLVITGMAPLTKSLENVFMEMTEGGGFIG